MRILVTGATGFVGQHLIRLLNKGEHQIFGTYLNENETAPVNLIRCDLRSRTETERVMAEVVPERLHHLGGFASVRDSVSSPRDVYDTNFGGTLNVLEAVRAMAPECRVLVVGSGQCYGAASAEPVDETYPLAPRTPYAGSKAAADLLAFQYFCSYKLHVVCARAFNHAGPGQSPHFVISELAKKVAAVDLGFSPPKIEVGNLAAQRDFTDVRDVVRAYELLLESGVPGEAYNVCSGRVVSIREVMDLLGKLCSRSIEVVDKSLVHPGELQVLSGSNEKLQTATGWRPEIPLAETVGDSFLYWKSQLTAKALAIHEESK
jgi:GDP-4-dehydro-6-deoxy-D-mannose reductase